MKKPDLTKFNTPETPRNEKQMNFRQALEKARKYDILIEKVQQDKKQINKELADLSFSNSFLRMGYKNGYMDGKIAAFKFFSECLKNYLGE